VVEATLYRMLGEKTADHDDLVQSVFEQIVLTLRRKSFAKICRLTSWAGAIASNLALNAIRRRRNERARNAEGGTDLVEAHQRSYHDLHEEVSARRDLERVRTYLGEMKEERAMPVVLCDVLGHSVPEVAVLLGASQAAVQSRLTRGRKELRDRFEEAPRTDPGGNR
jgi:RNA polymerase sigma-70 factor (ECF subfamily)